MCYKLIQQELEAGNQSMIYMCQIMDEVLSNFKQIWLPMCVMETV